MSEAELATDRRRSARRGASGSIVDLCYEQLIYEPVPHNLPKVLFARHARPHGALRVGVEGVRDDRLALRLGDRAEELIAPCNALQGHSTSNISSITQKAALAALTGPQDGVTEMLDEYRRRRDDICAAGSPRDPRHRVREAGGRVLPVPRHRGAAVADGHPDLRRVRRGAARRGHVVVTTPGEAFDAPGFLRISYATSMERLREGATRIRRLRRAAGRGRETPSRCRGR